MKISGGCYCGEIKYEADGEPRVKIQCHCRECQYFSGGHPNVVLGMSNSDFKYSKGAPKSNSKHRYTQIKKVRFCRRMFIPSLDMVIKHVGGGWQKERKKAPQPLLPVFGAVVTLLHLTPSCQELGI